MECRSWPRSSESSTASFSAIQPFSSSTSWLNWWISLAACRFWRTQDRPSFSQPLTQINSSKGSLIYQIKPVLWSLCYCWAHPTACWVHHPSCEPDRLVAALGQAAVLRSVGCDPNRKLLKPEPPASSEGPIDGEKGQKAKKWIKREILAVWDLRVSEDIHPGRTLV